jgi:hypothetical protein
MSKISDLCEISFSYFVLSYFIDSNSLLFIALAILFYRWFLKPDKIKPASNESEVEGGGN